MSTEIAREVVQRARAQGEELPGPVRQFVDWELEREERRSAIDAVVVGALSFMRSGDPSLGSFADVVVIKKFGDVPDNLDEL